MQPMPMDTTPSIAPFVIAALALIALAAATLLLRFVHREVARARSYAAEYRRAHTAYDQLLRHRIANPLAVVDGGIETLLALEDLDPATRRELLLAMRGASQQLRATSTDPAPRGVEELVLDARPSEIWRQPFVAA